MKKWTKEDKGAFYLIRNEGGAELGLAKDSQVEILEEDGFAFKDLNRNGKLDPYEDWRLPVEERVKDLSEQLSVEEIAGLMLYSSHQSLMRPQSGNVFAGRFSGTYSGKPFDPENGDISEMTDQQKAFLTEDHVRHILITAVENTETAARWNNRVQALCESMDHGIPVNLSSDPRHTAESNGEYTVGVNGHISQWPSSLGMAATFSPEIVKEFGEIMAKEYRSLGIATALSPQIDLASEPRWGRVNGTFGEGIKLSVDMARAYVDGCQTTADAEDGWGRGSVNAMVKHWPGGGSGEGGRDSHFNYGKYNVYPGNNFSEHLRSFTEGAYKLDGPTKRAAATMPYYSISYNQDKKYCENVGNSYNRYIIQDLLRGKYGYDEVICSDWGITHDTPGADGFGGMSWGVAHLNENERHYKALMAGIDQFGGNNDKKPVLAAYEMGVAAIGKEKMDARMRLSAKRLLRNIMRPGLFENPYLEPSESAAVTGCPEFMKAGYEAQKKSIVLLKNRGGVLPLRKKTRVYIPLCPEMSAAAGPFGGNRVIPAHPWVKETIAGKYFELTDDPAEAEAAIVFMATPKSARAGYSREEGYLPITLQYRPYTADWAREKSIACGDQFAFESPDRSYRGKSNCASNEKLLDVLLETKEKMGNKPVIVLLNASGTQVVNEFESLSDAILMGFTVSAQAFFELVTGDAEPEGLLPMQIPADMKTVEEQSEDVPRDMLCHEDAEGNVYDYGFGLNFSGQIKDYRTEKYI